MLSIMIIVFVQNYLQQICVINVLYYAHRSKNSKTVECIIQSNRFIEMKSVTKQFSISYTYYLLFCFEVMFFFSGIYFYFRVFFLSGDRTEPISVRPRCTAVAASSAYRVFLIDGKVFQ